MTVSGEVYFYSENVSASIATSGIPTDSRFIKLSGTPTPTHRNYLGVRSADATFAAADYTVNGTTVTLTVPTYTGNNWLSFAYPDSETISAVYLYQSGHRNTINQLTVFPTETSITLGGSGHTSRTSVDSLNGYGGYVLEMVFA